MMLDPLNDPWFEVIGTDGSLQSVGLAGAIEQLPQIYDVAEAVPLLRVAIRRLLFAIHLAGGTSHLAQFADRFTITGHAPFLCAPPLQIDGDDGPGEYRLSEQYPQFVVPEAQLDLFAAQKGGTLLDQRVTSWDGATPTTWRRAFTDLLVHQAWTPGGLLSAPQADLTVSKSAADAPLAGRASAWVVGPTLADAFEVMSAILGPVPEGDVPTWCPGRGDERRAPGVTPRTLHPAGPIEVLTWTPRRIELVGSADECKGVVISDGDRPIGGWSNSPDLPDVVWVGREGAEVPAAVAVDGSIDPVLCSAASGRIAKAILDAGLGGKSRIEVTALPHKQKAIHGSPSASALVLNAEGVERCRKLGRVNFQISVVKGVGSATAEVRGRTFRRAVEGGCTEELVETYASAVSEVLADLSTTVDDESSPQLASGSAIRRATRLLDELFDEDDDA